MFSRGSTSLRLAVAVAIPIFAMAVISVLLINRSWREAQSSEKAALMVETIAELSVFVSRLQVERGQSAIYLGSNAERPQSALSEARRRVDAGFEVFGTQEKRLAAVGSLELNEALTLFEAQARELIKTRPQIDSREIALTEVMSGYTKVIKSGLNVGHTAADIIDAGRIAVAINGMVDLGEAKEIAGQERGFVAGAIASGTLTDRENSRMQSFASVQEALIEVFVEQEPVERRAQYREMLGAAEIAAVAPMRNRIFDPQTDRSTIEASDWFRLASNRIRALYELEQEVARHLQADARHLADKRQTEVWVLAAFTIAAVIGAMFLAFLITRSVTRPLLGLTRAVGQIAKGNLDIEIAGTERRDELGAMASA